MAPLLGGFLKKFKKYIVKLKCANCGYGGEVKIPRGIPVDEFVQSGSFHCENCGCVTHPDYYETKWLK